MQLDLIFFFCDRLGTARPLPGSSIGYLPQEPQLEYDTVQECIDHAVQSSRDILENYNTMSMKLADPDLTEEEMTSTMTDMEKISDQVGSLLSSFFYLFCIHSYQHGLVLSSFMSSLVL